MGKFFSRTSWETSEYGGFRKILYDISLSMLDGFEIRDKSPQKFIPGIKDDRLPWYEYRTLGKLFLKEASLHAKGNLDRMIASAGYEIIEDRYTGDRRRWTFKKHDINTVLSALIASQSQYASLFAHYSKLIATSEFSFEPPYYNRMMYNNTEDLGNAIQNIREYEKYNFTKLISNEDLLNETKFEILSRARSDKNSEITYIDEHVKVDGNRIIKLLDINGDVSRNKLSSLHHGKLDSVKIVESLSGIRNIYYKTEEYYKTRPFQVAVILDSSGSMQCSSVSKEYRTETKRYGSKLECSRYLTNVLHYTFTNILGSDNVYMYSHTGGGSPIIHILNEPGFDDYEYTQKIMGMIDVSNNYDGIIYEKITQRIRTFTDRPVLTIVISDGYPSGSGYGSDEDLQQYKQVIEKSKRDMFIPVGLGFDSPAVNDFFKYRYVIYGDYSKMPENIAQILNSVIATEFKN